MQIREVTSLANVLALKPLFEEYIDFACSDLERATGVSFDRQVLLSNTLNGIEKVVPPLGRTFVADVNDADEVGMVFLRPSGPNAMEIKRLYVRPEARRTGAGRALVETTVAAARDAGAKALRLDTSANLTAAIALYQSMGFEAVEPYKESDHFDDPVLSPHLLFMAKPLIHA